MLPWLRLSLHSNQGEIPQFQVIIIFNDFILLFQGYSRTMGGFVKLGLINPDPYPSLSSTTPPLTWVSYSDYSAFFLLFYWWFSYCQTWLYLAMRILYCILVFDFFFSLEIRKIFFSRIVIRCQNRFPDRFWSVCHWTLSGLSQTKPWPYFYELSYIFCQSQSSPQCSEFALSLLLLAHDLQCKSIFLGHQEVRLCIKEYIKTFFSIKILYKHFFGLLLCCFSVLILGASLHLYLSQGMTDFTFDN